MKWNLNQQDNRKTAEQGNLNRKTGEQENLKLRGQLPLGFPVFLFS
jgi:hypothetical protein